ncbi:hypothetical protein [Jidongwangia harbinensis]|uniref:hypothetical protein n=1 Tax=Jidongwangia harbinensis TaxID=2878561 RepID=UPI001CD94693|nr:hypothetical protein [Jidongwangia harbinensis]MCA2218145.1 hypothetical protein [Jidongwangia harbinensis]
MIARVGASIVAVCLLGGCTWDNGDGRDRNPANQPGYVRPDDEKADPRRPHSTRGGAKTSAATFTLINGADTVRVRLGDLGDDLFEVATPDDAKVSPTVQVDGTTVVAGLRGTGHHGPAAVSVLLNDDVRWLVKLGAGAVEKQVDLTGGPGGNVELGTGSTRAEVALPAAAGQQTVTMTGGVQTMEVRLAGDAPVRVAVGNGAGSVTVDGQTRTGVPGGSVWAPPTWTTATDTYDINVAAGVSQLTVSRQ